MNFRCLVFLPVFLALFSVPVRAMDFQLEEMNDGHTGLAYRFLHPALENTPDYSALSGVHLFRALIPLGGDARCVVSAPFMVADFDGYDFEDKSAFGNIYVGLLGPRREDSGVRFHLGVRLPTAQNIPNGVANMGFNSDYLHMTRYLEDIATIRFGVLGEKGKTEGPYVRWGITPELMKPTGNRRGDMEILLNYGLGLGVRRGELEMGVEVVGIYLASADNVDFGHASHHQLSLGLQYTLGDVAPGVSFTFPLDEDLPYIQHTLNAHLKIRM